MHAFLVCRYISFVLIIILNLSITIFAAWHFTGLPAHSGDLPIVDPYLVVVSAMTVFFLPVILAVDLSRKDALPSKAWFEMLWLVLLWLLELGGGVRLSVDGSYFSCTSPFQTCTVPKILVALVWVSDLILLAHLLAVMVLTATTPRKPESISPLMITIRAHPSLHPPNASFNIVEPIESKRTSARLSKRRGSEILTLADGSRDTLFFGNESAEGYSPLGPSLSSISTKADAEYHSNMGQRRRSSSQCDNWMPPQRQYVQRTEEIPPVPPLPPMVQAQSRASVSTARQSVSPYTQAPLPYSGYAVLGYTQVSTNQQSSSYRVAHNAAAAYARMPSGGPFSHNQEAVSHAPPEAVGQRPGTDFVTPTTPSRSHRSQRPSRSAPPPSLSLSTAPAVRSSDRIPSAPTTPSTLRISAPLTSLPAFPAAAAKRISVHHAQSQRRLPSMIRLPAPLQGQRYGDYHGQPVWSPPSHATTTVNTAHEPSRASRTFPVISHPHLQPVQQGHHFPPPVPPYARPWNVNTPM